MKVTAEVYRTRWVEQEEQAEITVEVPDHLTSEEERADWIRDQLASNDKDTLDPGAYTWTLTDETENQLQYDEVEIQD